MAGASSTPFVFTTHDGFSLNHLPVSWKRRVTDGFVLRRAARVIALSRIEHSFLTGPRGLDAARVALIPNGISSTLFHPPTDPASRSDNKLLFVGQLKAVKGVEYLLKAMPAIRYQHPGVSLTLAYQTDALLDNLTRLARQLDIADTVSFIGPQNPEALRALYQRAALLVLPSLAECLSTVVLEAMFCGAPVVATDVGGIREQLDETSGAIVPPRSAEALSVAILRLLANPELRRNMGQAASVRAVSQFSADVMIDRHLRLYEDVRKQGPPRSQARNLFGMALTKLNLV
jgi:glycogen(starch) synthase